MSTTIATTTTAGAALDSTGSRIGKTPGVCGGAACIRHTRIPVWLLVEWRQLGQTDADLLEAYPTLSEADLHAAWDYYAARGVEIDECLRENAAIDAMVERIVTTPGVCGGAARIRGHRVPVWLLEAWRRDGMTEADVVEALPQLTPEDLSAAWEYIRSHTAEVEYWIRESEQD